MRPLIWLAAFWPLWLGAQYPLEPETIHMIRFDAADGTKLPPNITTNGSGTPTAFGGLYVPGTTSLTTNAFYAFQDPEEPDVRAFGFKRAANSNVAHLDLNLVNQTGRALKRLRVRMRVWQVSEQGRATAISVRYVQYPLGTDNYISQGPLFPATTSSTLSNLNPVRKAWIDHTIRMPTAVAVGDTFRVGIHFANGDGSGSNAHLAIEEIRLYPDFFPVTISDVSGWRMLAPPVSGATVADWNTYFGVQGAAGLPDDWAQANLYAGYDGVVWSPADQASRSTPSGTGLIWYRFPGPEKEAGLFGHEPTADVTVPLHADGSRWNLVGNPFASSIQVSSLRMNGEAPDVVAVWSTGDGTGPGSWVLSTDANLGGKVAAWQGFMLWNGDETPAAELTIPTTAKTTGGTFLKEATQWAALTIGLSRLTADSWVVHDRSAQVWIGRTPRAPIPRLPALSVNSGGISFNGRAIASVDADSGRVRIPLDLHLPSSGWWRIDWSIEQVPSDWQFRIFDRETGAETAFDEDSGYGFEAGSGDIRKRLEIVAIPRTTAIGESREIASESARLLSAWPNPFNPTTEIRWRTDAGRATRLSIHDVLGREVAVLVDGPMPPGEHRVRFDATGLGSGIYLVRLQSGQRTDIRRITLLK